MKSYAIIFDEENHIRVVPSKWLGDDLKTLRWPPYRDNDQIKKAIINAEEPDIDWSSFPVSKLIKYNDDYNKAITEMKLHQIELLTDPSDQEKMKKSRSFRNRRKRNPDFVNPVEKKKKHLATCEEGNSEQNIPKAPSSLSLLPGQQTPNVNKNKEPINNESLRSRAVLSDQPNDSGNNGEPIDSIRKQINDSDTETSVEFDECHEETLANKNTESTSGLPKSNSIIKDNSFSYENENEMQLQMFAMLKDIMKKLNTISLKMDTIDKRISSMEHKKIGNEGSISGNVLQLISEYFPINVDENHLQKKVESVEAKLQTDRIFFNNVFNRLMQYDNIDHYTGEKRRL